MDSDTDQRLLWVCAYANNQHDLGSEIPADPKESAFYKAMQLCDGVVVVLDGEATPFTRVWCCFEFAMVNAHQGLVAYNVLMFPKSEADFVAKVTSCKILTELWDKP